MLCARKVRGAPVISCSRVADQKFSRVARHSSMKWRAKR
jgi:hypothetical protein